MIETLTTGYAALVAVGLLIAAAVLYRRHLEHRRALSFVRRDANGHLYAQDPQSGVWHKLMVDPFTGSVTTAKKDTSLTPRQRRRMHGDLRRTLKAIQ